MQHGDSIGHGVMLAKDLGNLPANVCTPAYLARTAKKLASGNGKVTTKILNEAEMKRLGMGSLLSVTAGATEPAKLIVIHYKNGGSAKPIVLVGKGVTFDTGGISLKPGAGMDEMKFDMCGAASVIGTMDCRHSDAPRHQPDRHRACGREHAERHGDEAGRLSSRAWDGQTIEVLNTDAEGPVDSVRRADVCAPASSPMPSSRRRDADRRLRGRTRESSPRRDLRERQQTRRCNIRRQ